MIVKKGLFLTLLSIGIICMSGCETAAGIGKGFAGTATGAAAGARRDAGNIWNGILKADDWMRTNLW